MTFPNGIAFSPDEKTLYVANSDPKQAIWMAFDVAGRRHAGRGQGLLRRHRSGRREKGLPDGMKVDRRGQPVRDRPGRRARLRPRRHAPGHDRRPARPPPTAAGARTARPSTSPPTCTSAGSSSRRRARASRLPRSNELRAGSAALRDAEGRSLGAGRVARGLEALSGRSRGGHCGRLDDRRRCVVRDRRAVGVGQEHAAPPDRRPGDARRGECLDRRPEGRRAGASRSRRGDGLPAPRALSAPVGLREPGVRPPRPQGGAGGVGERG